MNHHDAVVTIEPVTRSMRKQFGLPRKARKAVVGHWDGGDYLLSTDADCPAEISIEAVARAHAQAADAAFGSAA